MAYLLVPTHRGEDTDWKAYSHSISRWFFVLLLLAVVRGVSVSVVYPGAPLKHLYRAFQSTLLALAAAGFFVRSDAGHGALAMIFFAIFLIG